MHPCVYCSIVYNSQAMETAQETISRGVEKKQWYIYAMKYYLAVKKKEILPFAKAWMELESTILSEINQSKKDKYYVVSLICRI